MQATVEIPSGIWERDPILMMPLADPYAAGHA
jgi:hypothetical protein